ncbi:MAG: hypothetical protein R3C05_09390 [Pirellulaceae bacterium]
MGYHYILDLGNVRNPGHVGEEKLCLGDTVVFRKPPDEKSKDLD